MSRKANPTVIGAFIVGALLIAVAAVMVFTSGALFQQKLAFVLYFEGSVKGLNVGAPVSYRGVQVGIVTDVAIVLSPDQNARIPVTIQIDPAAFTWIGYDRQMSLDEMYSGIRKAVVSEGLRAQLQMQSLLTGQLFIQLDYFPDTPGRFIAQGDTPEIPTVPTPLQELSSILQDFPVQKVLDDFERLAAALAELAANEKLRDAIGSAALAFEAMKLLMNDLDARSQALGPTLVEAQRTLVEGRRTLAQTTATLQAAQQTFAQATASLSSTRALVSEDSELLAAIEDAFAAVTDAANAVAALADTLERRPEAILRGKGVLGGD